MTDLQSTNRTKLSKSREAVYGVTDTNPVFKQVRQTSSGLNANPQTIQTDEIRPDRQVTDLILVGLTAGGPIGGELSFYAHDEDLEEALQGTWSNNPSIEVVTIDTEISAVSTTTLTVASGGAAFKAGMLVETSGFETAGNNKLARVSSSTGTTIVFPAATFAAEANPIPVGAAVRVIGFEGASGDITATTVGGNALLSTVLDFTTLGISVGEWIKIGSSVTDTSFAGTAADNGWARVSAIAAARLSLDIVPAGWATDAAAAKTIRVFTGDFLTNASTKRSNTFERQYLDHSPASYEYFTGQVLNTMSITMDSKAIVKLSKTYIGSEGSIDDARVSGATDIAAPTYDVMNTTANFGDIMIDGTIVAGPNFIMAASFEINNNLRQQPGMGHLGAVGIGNGEFSVTGRLNTYFGSPAIYEKILSNEETSFSCRVTGGDTGNPTYMFDIPSLKFSAGAPSVTGKNADVMIDGTYQGIMHSTLGYTMSIGRFWNIPD